MRRISLRIWRRRWMGFEGGANQQLSLVQSFVQSRLRNPTGAEPMEASSGDRVHFLRQCR